MSEPDNFYCKDGEIQGKEVLCRSSEFCEFQCWDPVKPGDIGPTYCGREDAAIAAAEQYEKELREQ